MVQHIVTGGLDIEGPAGLRLQVEPVGPGMHCERRFVVRPGTPSIFVALHAPEDTHLDTVRVALEGPDGALRDTSDGGGVAIASLQGNPVAITAVDPMEGTWTAHVDWSADGPSPIHLQLLATPYEEAFDALLAASIHVPLDGLVVGTGAPAETIPFLNPAGRALQPLCGTQIDIDEADHAVPVVAASDLTGAHPDDIADHISGLRHGAPTEQVIGALAAAACL